MLDRPCSSQTIEEQIAVGLLPPSRYDFTLAEAILELGIRVGPGSLDGFDIPPITSTVYDPDEAILATSSLARNPKVAPASYFQQVLHKSSTQPSQTPHRTLPVAQSSSVNASSHSRAATAGEKTPQDQQSCASASLDQPLAPTTVRPKAMNDASSHRPRVSTGSSKQPATQTQLALTKLPPRQVSNQLVKAPQSYAPQRALVTRPVMNAQQRTPLNELPKYVEHSIERRDPLQSDFAISGNFTPGGFGLRVRSQSHRVQHNGHTGRTVGMYSVNILQQDTNGNALMSGIQSDIQGSWTQVRQAIQGLQSKQARDDW